MSDKYFVIHYSIVDYDYKDVSKRSQRFNLASSLIEFVEQMTDSYRKENRESFQIDSIYSHDSDSRYGTKISYGVLKAFAESKSESYIKEEMEYFLQRQQEEYSKKETSLREHFNFLKENYA